MICSWLSSSSRLASGASLKPGYVELHKEAHRLCVRIEHQGRKEKGQGMSFASFTVSEPSLNLGEDNLCHQHVMKPKLRSKHRKTLQAIFEKPVRANIPWADIESLLVACGAEISEGRGLEYALPSMMYGLCSTAHIRGKKPIEAQWLPCAVF